MSESASAEMAQHVQAPAAKPDNLGPNPWDPRGRSRKLIPSSYPQASTYIYIHKHMHKHTYILTVNINENLKK